MPQPPIFKPTTDKLKNSLAAVVGRAIRSIKRFVTALHNKCNLVVYVDTAGRTCSTFLKKDAFTGYHFEFQGDRCAVTNKETGDLYVIMYSPTCKWCPCESYKYSPRHDKNCKHLRMVAELKGDIEQAIAQTELDQYIEKQADSIAPEIDPNDVPCGCRLERTDDWISVEYNVHAWGYQNIRGVRSLIQKNIGRIVQMSDGIYTYRVTSGIARTFQATQDAIAYLVRIVGTSFEEIAAAYEERMEFKKRVARC